MKTYRVINHLLAANSGKEIRNFDCDCPNLDISFNAGFGGDNDMLKKVDLVTQKQYVLINRIGVDTIGNNSNHTVLYHLNQIKEMCSHYGAILLVNGNGVQNFCKDFIRENFLSLATSEKENIFLFL